jgi:hypothetical protein
MQVVPLPVQERDHRGRVRVYHRGVRLFRNDKLGARRDLFM